MWLRVEHAPANRVSIDAWLTDPTVFARARDSRAELFAEVADFGLQLEHFAVFNQARDTVTEPLSAPACLKIGRPVGLVGMKELDEIKAIALEYGKREAPSILAKGEGEEAMSIIDAAFDLGLPVIEDEALQRLLSGVDIGEEVPESLYRAVAVVLAWVFWLRGDEPGRG